MLPWSRDSLAKWCERSSRTESSNHLTKQCCRPWALIMIFWKWSIECKYATLCGYAPFFHLMIRNYPFFFFLRALCLIFASTLGRIFSRHSNLRWLKTKFCFFLAICTCLLPFYLSLLEYTFSFCVTNLDSNVSENTDYLMAFSIGRVDSQILVNTWMY